jgi:hypothetical protein
MGVLLGRSSAGRQVLTASAGSVVPTGILLRGPDTSLDVRPSADSDESAGLDESRPLAGGLNCSPGSYGATCPAATAVYVAAPSGDPSCRPLEAA